MVLLDSPVLLIDCQASGATPAHGELLEIGWTLSGATTSPRAHWTAIKNAHVSMPVRKLTGWEPSCLETAIDPLDAWRAMLSDARTSVEGAPALVPAVIHYARFELPFLRDLHARATNDVTKPFPLDVVCLHAIAARLFPELPRRNIRALAGHLGHSAEMIRRARGHVEATAFLWKRLVPMLAEMSISTWEDLKQWLEIVPAPSSGFARRGKREFPLDPAKRKGLPDAPGVYRFLRPNGDVLYVGKAVSLKKRVGSHFTTAARSRGTERAIEMLTQAHDIAVTTVATALEAALLECDEIKRLDPPYNVQLRARHRSAWFASRSWATSSPASNDVHVTGPMPSPNAIAGIAAIRAVLEDHEGGAHQRTASLTDDQRSAMTGVPRAFAPPAELFSEVWQVVLADHFRGDRAPRRKILDAAKQIDPKMLEEEARADEPIDTWDLARVRRHIERTIASEVAVIRRSRLLALLTDCHIAFREASDRNVVRHLVIAGGEITSAYDSLSFEPITPQGRPPPRGSRLRCFDAARYDRLRVLSTELRRIADEGGAVIVNVGHHRLSMMPGTKPQRRRRSSIAGTSESLSSGDEATIFPLSSTRT